MLLGLIYNYEDDPLTLIFLFEFDCFMLLLGGCKVFVLSDNKLSTSVLILFLFLFDIDPDSLLEPFFDEFSK